MRTNRFLLSCAAAIAAAMLFAPTGAEGAAQVIAGVCSDAPVGGLPSCTCKSPSGYTIQLQQEIPTPNTQTTYRYLVSGGGNAKVNAIRDVQIIVPRPVSNTNLDPTAGKGVILAGDVTSINTYCQADPNSGNNKGNCDGFLVHAAVHSATNTSGLVDIPVGNTVADGMVTFNLIGGNGNTELCSAVNDTGGVISPPSGISGPGDIGDPFQPKFNTQDATVADGKCIAHLIFDKKGNVIDVTASNAPGFVPGPGEGCIAQTAVSPTNPNGDIFIQDSQGNPFPLKNNTGPHGFTFGNGTTTCYGPSIPSPAKCVCSKTPCP